MKYFTIFFLFYSKKSKKNKIYFPSIQLNPTNVYGETPLMIAAKNSCKLPIFFACMCNTKKIFPQFFQKKRFNFQAEDFYGKNPLHYISKDVYIGLINFVTFYEEECSIMLDHNLKRPVDYIGNQFLISKKISKKSYKNIFSKKTHNLKKNNALDSNFKRLSKLSKIFSVQKIKSSSLKKKIEAFSTQNSNLEFKTISFSKIRSNNLNPGIKFSKMSFNSFQKLSTRLKHYQFSNRIIPTLRKINALRGSFIVLEKEVNRMTEFSIQKDILFVKNEWKVIQKKIYEICYFLFLIRDKISEKENILSFEKVYEEKLSDILEILLDFLSFNPTVYHIVFFKNILILLRKFSLCKNLLDIYTKNFIENPERFFYRMDFHAHFKLRNQNFIIVKKGNCFFLFF